jgi:hypothetical protein
MEFKSVLCITSLAAKSAGQPKNNKCNNGIQSREMALELTVEKKLNQSRVLQSCSPGPVL